ncbi:LysR family transcriptional regulator [Pseudomonas sp. BN102]|uniref:LysR family transcriptional regulator n=1 Tax=Pseudomonas sp. BN102 TaxID=2567886 RepID=UPI00245486DE|nr:LysR family transcriptional regulator [Pseudomonas sp. BN102]MDH4609055.1 LysR family transcriptional regulator [Pseudomonas sp. BN102]
MLTQLRDMDLQLLRIFVTIVENGGFSAAQGKLGIAQSTISTQMSKLETRLGFRLCERGKSGFRLTPKGERVLQSAKRLLEALNAFTRETQDVSQVLLGELHIGISELLAPAVIESIARAVGNFRRRAPEVIIEIISVTPAELERQLLNNEIQLAIGYFSEDQAGLNYEPLFVEKQALFCGTQHPLFAKKSVNLDDLTTANKVAHLYKTNSVGSRLRSKRQTAVSEQADADLIFTLSGAHISFLPEHIAEPWESAGKLRKLLPEELSYDVSFHLATAKNREASEVLEIFKEHLLAQFS